jgi:serine phosphatase RsbU (regulator of sigma subunit)
MASLRFAIRAYAAQSDPPELILNKLTHLVNVADDGQLATVLCALVDPEQGEITVTSAGHLPPLLLSNGDGRFIDAEVGLPIGVETGSRYASTTVGVVPGAGTTLMAFTDGLVEVRGESIDEGLERLRRAAAGDHGPLSDLLTRLVSELGGGSSDDDIAIVGVRWTS